ncbi:MAG: glucose-6-phosphate dehydrogenase [Sphingomonadaceae bacterium]|nr:glucose-6-phosphate dehydrogenase [Sphingomonadaceae bacterium]
MSAPTTLVLFGATGDLAQRMLFPALYHLWREGRLSAGLRFVGAARSELSDDSFRGRVADSLSKRAAPQLADDAAIREFAARWCYVAADAEKPDGLAPLKSALGESAPPALYYLATAPQLFGPIAQALAAAGLAGRDTRVMVEKPIGRDLASSMLVNDALAAVFSEEQIFRVDHYLGKETVQNLLALRFGNALFEPLWGAQGVAYVEITVAETVGLEDRAGYYEGAGALRDMMQNHVLQLLALVAMEPPASIDAPAIRNEKVKVLRCLRPLTAASVEKLAVAGQYGPGTSDGQSVRGYADELGRASRTETFAAVRADIENWRWAGVPFYLRTGKRMARRFTEIVVHFRPVPHSIFERAGGRLSPNKLILNLQPDEDIQLTLMAKEPGLEQDGARLRELPLDLSLAQAFPDARRRIAYERLLLDALAGNQTLFVRRDEVEAAWAWVDSIYAAWAEAEVAPRPYASGSFGPSASIALPERFGHSWHE